MIDVSFFVRVYEKWQGIRKDNEKLLFLSVFCFSETHRDWRLPNASVRTWLQGSTWRRGCRVDHTPDILKIIKSLRLDVLIAALCVLISTCVPTRLSRVSRFFVDLVQVHLTLLLFLLLLPLLLLLLRTCLDCHLLWYCPVGAHRGTLW